MALTTAEIQQCKSWLGYGNLTALARPYFDIALVFEDVIANTLDVTWAEGYVRTTILVNLTAIDGYIQGTYIRFQAAELTGEWKQDNNELDKLLNLQNYWIKRLSAVLKIPIASLPGGGPGTMEVY